MTHTQELITLLCPTSTTKERLEGLSRIGIPPARIARLAHVSPSTVRNWTSGQAEPKAAAAAAVDDVRAVASLLLAGGVDAERVKAWFQSRNHDLLQGARPLDVVWDDPMRVLTAAHGLLLDNQLADAATKTPLRVVASESP